MKFIIPNYNQQDATFLDLFLSTDPLHVPYGSSAHHQEHTTVHTASGIVTGYFSKSGTRAPPREYYAWWSLELLRVYRLGGNKNNCGWDFFRFIHTYTLLVISLTFAINYLRPALSETLSTKYTSLSLTLLS